MPNPRLTTASRVLVAFNLLITSLLVVGGAFGSPAAQSPLGISSPHVLAVVYHPKPAGSYTRAILDAAIIPLIEAGVTVDVADLTAEQFNPAFSHRDLAHFHGNATVDRTIRSYQQRVDRADAIIIAFPIYWWTLPSVLKGWVDRVFARGWAFAPGDGGQEDITGHRGMLKDRPVLILATGSSSEATYDEFGYRKGMEAQIKVGVFGYCGITDVRLELLLDNENPEARKGHLERAAELGRELIH